MPPGPVWADSEMQNAKFRMQNEMQNAKFTMQTRRAATGLCEWRIAFHLVASPRLLFEFCISNFE
jgi:hypothetical protein